MRAYLDFNIIVALNKNELSISDILQIDPNISQFPYSAAHIQEIDNIYNSSEQKRHQYINSHLKSISEISNNLYLYQELDNDMLLIHEPPSEVLNTIREVPFAKTVMQSFTKILNHSQREEFINILGINVNEINNYSPSEVVNQFDKILNKSEINCTFLDLIENSLKMYPQRHKFGLSERLAVIYEMIDLLGYWKDKQTDTSNYARFWDSNHAFFAAHCNYFVSDDIRNRYKAKVAYNLFNVGTIVVDSKGCQ